ncbi:transposase, partial [Candidatus Peregrinibacteria bacterium]|nr:transposase [Candidatus Peregrinibacteria bacterium]
MRVHLPLRGQRLEFLAQFVLGLITVRTVNLTQIALTFCSKAKTASSC